MNQKQLFNLLRILIITLSFSTFSCSSKMVKDNNQTNNISVKSDSNQHIKQLVQRQAKAWETANSQAIIADFAENGVFIAPSTSLKGKTNIHKAAEDYFQEFTDTKIKITRIIAGEKEAAIEWTWNDTNKKTGKKSQVEDAIIFQVEDGKITYWREYFDKKF